MPDISIEKADWADFLNWVTDSLAGAQAEIDVLSLKLGAQAQARSLPLLGLAYDRKSDVIEVALEGLDHLVHRPRKLAATQDDSGLLSIEIVDADKVRQIVKLTRPLSLPAPFSPNEPSAWKQAQAQDRLGRSML